MPHTVETLRTTEHATQAYVLLMDGIPVAFTTDSSGDIEGEGGGSWIGRFEAGAAHETTGARRVVSGLRVPDSLEFGGDISTIAMDRTTASFSVMRGGIEDLLALGGEEPEELLGRLAPYTDPAPASIVGVTVRDRYVGLERIGPDGERHMFPCLTEPMAGLDHHGDTDGGVVASTVSQRPLSHEGRMVALYRVYKDPSPDSTSSGLAWPTLDNYRPIWVGKMRDAGTITAGGRITIECTGFESLLERNMGFPTAETTAYAAATTTAGLDDQVAIYFSASEAVATDFTTTSKTTLQGRSWTTLAGETRLEIRASLADLIDDTVAGTDTDFETGADTFDATNGGDAGFSGDALYVQREQRGIGEDYRYLRMTIAMHRRRWLALGFDPEQQDWSTFGLPTEDSKQAIFRKLASGTGFVAEVNSDSMGLVPAAGYYAATFITVPVGRTSLPENATEWDNNGSERRYDPIFEGVDVPNVIKQAGGQVLRLTSDIALLPSSHVPRSGSIDGTDCDAAGYVVLRGRIRKAEGSTDNGTLIVEDETEQVAVARVSWVVRDDYFASPGAGVSPALYIEQLHDPRTFGLPFAPLRSDWATIDLRVQQLHTLALGTSVTKTERADQILSAMLRSTGTSTGPDGAGIIDQGDNSGCAVGFFGDIFAAEHGLGIPSSLLATQADITAAFAAGPGGIGSELNRQRISWHDFISSHDLLRALLEPRGLRIGFDGGALGIYRLVDSSPNAATIAITESDLYGEPGDPTSVYPQQSARFLAPVDAWEFGGYGDGKRTHLERARDPGASTRRGDNVVSVSAVGLVAPEMYGDDPTAAPPGAGWKNEARLLFGGDVARWRARRHGKVTVPISRPKGQDVYPGALVTISNPWPMASDGSRGLVNVVGRVVAARHGLKDDSVEADILVFEGQAGPPPLYAPYLWIERRVTSTRLTIHTSPNLPADGQSIVGWTEPAWSTAGGGNAVAALWRQLPTGGWSLVGTAQVASVTATTVNLATALTASPQTLAHTMLLTLHTMANQPAWAQAMYSAVAVQGDNTRARRFV